MLSREQFFRTFDLLAARFGKDFGQSKVQIAAGYYAYLESAGMTDSQLEESARAVFATAKFFPRPADFLVMEMGDEWATVLESAALCCPPEWGWAPVYERLSDRSKRAVQALGGMHTLKSVIDRDVVKAKQAWERAYEQATESHARALPSPAERRAQLRAVNTEPAA